MLNNPELAATAAHGMPSIRIREPKLHIQALAHVTSCMVCRSHAERSRNRCKNCRSSEMHLPPIQPLVRYSSLKVELANVSRACNPQAARSIVKRFSDHWTSRHDTGTTERSFRARTGVAKNAADHNCFVETSLPHAGRVPDV